jgi:hypothetical protein
MYREQILIRVACLAVFGFLFFIFLFLKRTEIPQIGTLMPKVIYHDRQNIDVLKADTTRFLMVVLAKMSCEHCLYELDVIDKNMHTFKDVKVIILITDKMVHTEDATNRWPKLRSSNNVTFGSIDWNEARTGFGKINFPSFLFYDSDGVLKNIITGETNFARLQDVMNGLAIRSAKRRGNNKMLLPQSCLNHKRKGLKNEDTYPNSDGRN